MTKPFLDKDYEVSKPKSDYMRFQAGDNRFRILDIPLVGWVWWLDAQGNYRLRGAKPQKGDKPVRVRKDDDVPVEAGETVKEFWALPVWNYTKMTVKKKQVDTGIQILELTQKGILRTITALSRDKEWGSPLNYDINIGKQGELINTEYEVVPAPPKELREDIKDAWEKATCRLDALLDGGHPLKARTESTEGSDPTGLVS